MLSGRCSPAWPWPHMLDSVTRTMYPEFSGTRWPSEVSLSQEHGVHPALRNFTSPLSLGQLESRLSNSPELPEPASIPVLGSPDPRGGQAGVPAGVRNTV